jgi:hypothetical protein
MTPFDKQNGVFISLRRAPWPPITLLALGLLEINTASGS